MSTHATAFLGALLAGGGSRRMGAPKEGVELGGRPLAAWAARALAAAARPTVQIGGRPIPGLDWPTWPDVFPDGGPAAGIATALRGAGGGSVLVVAVDLPFITAGLLRAAADAVAAGATAAVPRRAGRWHPLAGAWSPAALGPLDERLRRGRRDLQSLLDRLPAHAIEGHELERHGDPDRLLLNVNTPEDLRRARELLDPQP